MNPLTVRRFPDLQPLFEDGPFYLGSPEIAITSHPTYDPIPLWPSCHCLVVSYFHPNPA
jgi:hypothetical protein